MSRQSRTHRMLRNFIREQLGTPTSGLVGVELGVYEGETSANLLKHLPDLYLIMIDPWMQWMQGSTYYEQDPKMGKKNNAEWAAHRAKAFENVDPYRDRTQIIQATGDLAVLMFEYVCVDFVFIDANHTYEAVRDDILAWLPKIKPGGLICGHDYGGRQAGVQRAVDEAFGDRVMAPGNILWGVQT